MLKANQPSAPKRGRPRKDPGRRAVQVQAQQLLINRIEAGSQLNARQLEEVFQVGALGINGKTGRTWSRWKAGTRTMSSEQRDRVGRLAVKRGWLPPVHIHESLRTDAEMLAFESLRGYNPTPGLTFDRSDDLDLQKRRRQREETLQWAQSYTTKYLRAKAQAIAALTELRSIYQATALDLPLEPEEPYEGAQLRAMTVELESMALDLYFPTPYWDA